MSHAPRSHLHFRRSDLWVRPALVPRMLGWLARRRLPWRLALAQVRGARLVHHPPPLLEVALAGARALGLSADVVRLPRDSTRAQVFDLHEHLVVHVSKPGYARVERELALRSRLPTLPSPRVRRVASDHRAFAEDLFIGRPARSLREGAPLLRRLVRELYDIEPVAFPDWVRTLEAEGELDAVSHGLIAALEPTLGDAPMPVSLVHGDANPGNVLIGARGALTLLDWEYARPALCTYDAWVLHLTLGGADLPAWLATLGLDRHVAHIPPKLLGLAHRLERYTFLSGLRPRTAHDLRSRLARELVAATENLHRQPPRGLGACRE